MHCSPSSPRKGSCCLIALLGRAGTTILLWENIIVCLLCFALLVSTKASKSFRKGSEKPQNAFLWKIVLDRLQFCYWSFVKFHCLSMNKLVNAKTTKQPVPLQFVPQPLKVREPPPHTWLFHAEHWQICLQMESIEVLEEQIVEVTFVHSTSSVQQLL